MASFAVGWLRIWLIQGACSRSLGLVLILVPVYIVWLIPCIMTCLLHLNALCIVQNWCHWKERPLCTVIISPLKSSSSNFKGIPNYTYTKTKSPQDLENHHIGIIGALPFSNAVRKLYPAISLISKPIT